MPPKPRRQRRKPAKLVLSPTRIATYLACPLMYKFTYIDKIARYYYKPKPGHSFGASLHRALQGFHEQGGSETQTVEQLAEHLRDTWVATGYQSVIDEQEQLEEGIRILEEYHAAPPTPGVTTIMMEKQLRQDMGDFILMGRIDRMDQLADGTLEIIDYKSGRPSVTEEEVRDDLAMGIYQLLCRLKYPTDRVTGSILCLRSGVKATVELSSQGMAALESDVRAIAAEILAIDEDSEIPPTPKEHCLVCDFQRLCAKLRARNED